MVALTGAGKHKIDNQVNVVSRIKTAQQQARLTPSTASAQVMFAASRPMLLSVCCLIATMHASIVATGGVTPS